MQLGIHPALAERIRSTGFPFELDESPESMTSSRGIAEAQPRHPFATSTTFYGIEVEPTKNGPSAVVDKLGDQGVITQVHLDPEKYEWMTRQGIDYCFGWTSYPRFAPSRPEIQLMNLMFPDYVALPFSSYYAAEITLQAFLNKFPQMVARLHLMPCRNTDGWCLVFTDLDKDPEGLTLFNELREIREYLGTGMSARQATYELLASKDGFRGLIIEEQRKLTDDLIDEYKKQFISLHELTCVGVNPRDLTIGPNGTIVLVDVLVRMKEAMNTESNLTVSTAGVPYSDTPITIEVVTGIKPLNTRSQNVAEIIESSKDADVIFIELGDNPLLQATDLEILNEYAAARDIPIIVDVTVVGSGNIDFEKLFKLEAIFGATISTTKYNSGTGMGGAFVSNPLCTWTHTDRFRSDTSSMLEVANGEMFWADMAVHLRDLATYQDRLRMHNKNTKEVVSLLSQVNGLKINYPTQNHAHRFIDPFLKENGGYGGLLSVEFDPHVFKQDEIVKIINELPKHMTNALSFGLPFSVALPYAATVFPGKSKQETGCDPFILRISMGMHPGEAQEVNTAIRTAIQNVIGVNKFLELCGRDGLLSRLPFRQPIA